MLQFAAALFLLSLPLSVEAGFATNALDKNWKNADEVNPILQTQVCRASTEATTSKEKVELSFVYPKDAKVLPAVFIRTKIPANQVTLKLSPQVSEAMLLLNAATTAEETNVFWYAPVNFSRLENIVRERDTLEILVNNASIKVSLAGSSNSLDQVQKCLKGGSAPEGFFKLLNQTKDNLVPDLGDRSVSFLFKTVQEAFNAYNAGVAANADLAKLRKSVEGALKKEAAAKESFVAAQGKFTKAQEKLNSAKAQVSSLETKIAEAKSSLANLMEAKGKAEQTLAEKKAVYAPLKEQMKPYETKLADAQKTTDSLKSEISNNESLVSGNERKIRSLESERDSLRREIPGLERDVENLRIEYSRAESNLNSYNREWEKRRILDGDWSYQNSKREFESKSRELDRARYEVRDEERKAEQARRELQICRAKQPPEPCAIQESNLSQAERARDQARNKENSLESDLQSLKWRLDRDEDDATRKVNDEYDRLARIRDDFASSLRSKQNELANDQERLEDIRVAIPKLRAQIDRANAALPGLRQKLTDAQVVLAQAQRDLQQFSEQIGFGNAEKEFLAAQKNLADITQGIAQKNKEIPILEKNLVAAKKLVDPLAKDFAKAEGELSVATQNLAKAQEPLKNFREQEAKILAEVAAQGDRFKTGRAIYQDLLKFLVSGHF